jgi:hypothetical protein
MDRPRVGAPRRLNPELERVIIDAVEKGNHLTVACALAGINDNTLYRWLRTADAIEVKLDQPDPEPVSDEDLALVRFRDRLRLARGTAEARAVAIVQQVMAGEALIEEKPALSGDGLPIYDSAGELVYERKWAQPNGRLALDYLSRSAPSRWAPKIADGFDPPQSTSGAGAPDPGVPPAVVDALVNRLREFTAARAAVTGPAETTDGAGDVAETVDGVLVDGDATEDEG